jgi:hypothetical protein
MPHPTMSTSTGRGATVVQAFYLFAGAALGPQNFLHHDTVSRYGIAASNYDISTATTCHHDDDDCVNARIERKASNREHLMAFSFYFRTSRYCNLTPPFAYYKRGGRDPRQNKLNNTQQQQCTKYTLKHSNIPAHKDLGAIPLSTSLYPPSTSTSVQSNTSSSEH